MHPTKNILLILISSAMIAHASESNTFTTSGSAKISQQHYTNLKTSGKIEAESISASGLTTVSGSAKISNSRLNAMHGSGTLSLENSQIDGNIKMSGSLKINHSKLNGQAIYCSGSINSSNNNYLTSIKLSGNLYAKNDQFNALISGSGNIYAESSVFKQPITLATTKSNWSNSLIESNIIINTAEILFRTPTLTFKNTRIHGDITFTKAKGMLILSGNSKITGKVINAEVKQE